MSNMRTPEHMRRLMKYVRVDNPALALAAVEAIGALVISDGNIESDSIFAVYTLDHRYEMIMRSLTNPC